MHELLSKLDPDNEPPKSEILKTSLLEPQKSELDKIESTNITANTF
jgi:hypothetical protein